MMNKQELSERIAGLYNVASHMVESPVNDEKSEWLIDDTARMFELAVEHDIEYLFLPWFNRVVTGVQLYGCRPYPQDWRIDVNIKDHPTKLEATLWGIGLALVKKAETK
jgi:hypothetical protein